MTRLFQPEITDWQSWGKVFQSVEAFCSLIREICKKEGIPANLSITPLPPGTNAVFRLENFVIKLFAPKESGLDTLIDFQSEQFGIAHAQKQGILTSNIVACGEIQDQYLFRYLLIRYLTGISAGEFLLTAESKARQTFLCQLKQLCQKLNLPVSTQPFLIFDFYGEFEQNERWSPFPAAFRQQALEQIAQMDFSNLVYVHGDLTEDNLIVTPKGELACIDFADNKLAPADYELPPILFSLFGFQKDLIKAYQADEPNAHFIRRILQALLIHDFGGDFVQNICQKILKISPNQLCDLHLLENGLTDFLS